LFEEGVGWDGDFFVGGREHIYVTPVWRSLLKFRSGKVLG